ncbi:MAG: TatD family hydrolase [Gammaproteobacteria bacterium]
MSELNTELKLVDSHCHLPLIEYDGGLDQILKNAKEAEIGHMLCISVDLESYPEIKQIAADHDHIFASVGVHPNTDVQTEPTVEILVDLSKNDPNVVAIGETGLDYFRSEGDLTWQHNRFITHIEAANIVDKPLIIHTREAGDDTIAIMKEHEADKATGVMHCFVDDYDIAKKALDLNFYISFSGIVTFKNAQQVQDVAKRIPLDRLLVETGCPYLAPVPHRGKINQPAYVRHVAEFVANLRGITVEEVIQASTTNFFTLFKAAKA